jgi:hypothetical protein
MNYLGLTVGLLTFVWFFRSLGKNISIRNVFAVLMSLQFLVSPFFVYNGLEEYQWYKMKVAEETYFNFVTPAMIAFLIGLYLGGRKKNFEYKSTYSLKFWYNRNKEVPYIFIGGGFICSFLQPMVSGELGFVMYLLASLKFVGLLLLMLGTDKMPMKITLVVMGSILLSSFANVMFHDLFIWSILILCSLSYRLQLSIKIKLLAILLLVGSAIVIQSLKSDLRYKVWEQGEDLSLDLVEGTLNQVSEEKGGILSFQNLAPQIIRINQGWIVSSIMENVPQRVPFANGETIYQYIESALLPRFLAPNKLNAGDKDIFNKYSGHTIIGSTSMALSSVGDAYINFGVSGGWMFMFFYGLLFNLIIRYFVKISTIYPTAYVFSFLILFYAIRPDCELQTILGHLAKTSLLLFLLFRFFGKYFRIRSLEEDIKG